jgi:branched-chain amino acid transport system substrate-binding protein
VPEGFKPGVTGNPKAAFGRSMLRGAQIALEEANAGGGYRDRPFRLVVRTDLVLWGQTSNELVKFAYEDGVWGILSGIESNHNHVLARASLKAEVPIVNAGSSDPTLVEHAIPWMSRVISDDRQNTFVLIDYMYRVQGLRRPALLRTNDRDARMGVEEFVQGYRRLGSPVVIEQRFSTGDTDFGAALERIAAADPDSLVLWGNPRETALAVRQLRGMGLRYPVYGFDRLVHPEFLRTAGEHAEGVVAVAAFRPDEANPHWRRFREEYRKSFDEEPDSYAAHGYDAMRVLIEAIRRAGLNRARIRDAIYELERVPGATGTLTFDTNMSDIEEPWLAEARGGRFRYFKPEAAVEARGDVHGRETESLRGGR